ncbi:MAG: hypothetical protein EP343_09335 [Deltaproteobacteria bacterium]|nr:MAG: hypothetical protein EP343_09335 [Deltaproteobacteria bacterium]
MDQLCRQGYCLDRVSLLPAGAFCQDTFDCLSGVCAQGTCASLFEPSAERDTIDASDPFVPEHDGGVAQESFKEATPEAPNACNQPGCERWTMTGGGLSTDTINAIDVDAEGNIYITGQMAGSIKFGATLVEAWAQKDAYVAKFDANGNVVWASRFGGSLDDKGSAIVVDSRGYVTIAGEFRGTIGTKPKNLVSHDNEQEDIFVAHFSPKGELVWAHAITGPGADGSRALAVDNQNNMYLVGAFYYSSSFQGTVLQADHDYSAFVTKISPEGSFQWTRQSKGIGFEIAESVTVNAKNNITIAGKFLGGATFGTLSLQSKANDIFVAQLDSEGAWLWAKGYGGPGDEALFKIVSNDTGELWGAANCSHNSVLGSTTLNLPTGLYACVVKMDSQGNVAWVKHTKEPTLAGSLSLAVDTKGTVFFGGYNSGKGPLLFGEHSLPASQGATDGFVAALSAEGSWLWAHGLTGPHSDAVTALHLSKDNDLVVAGFYSDQATFQWFAGKQASKPFPSLGDSDVFLTTLQHSSQGR